MSTQLPKNVIFIRSLFARMRNHPVRSALIGLGIFILLSLCDVPYRVSIGQIGVVRRFGRYVGEMREPGLNFRFPWGIDRVIIVDAEKVHTFELTGSKEDKEISGKEYFTGDENLIDIRCSIQYQISSSPHYLFQSEFPEQIILDHLQELLIGSISSYNVDSLLGSDKEIVQEKLLKNLKILIEPLELGVELVSLNLDWVMPPPAAVPAFQDVFMAKEERYLSINQAEKYKTETINEAQGLAERVMLDAEAYAYTRVKLAHGAEERFRFLLTENKRDPEETMLSEYFKTMSKVVSQADVYVIRPGQGAQLEMNLMDQVSPPKGVAKKAKGKKEKKAEVPALLLPPTIYETSTDRAPGAGGHEELYHRPMHQELPTTTAPITPSEIQVNKNE
ncbi:MAG: protease modulator HflK [Chlamydiales bacterium]|nr:protease modulator HflK [Chlamydiales bacterium]